MKEDISEHGDEDNKITRELLEKAVNYYKRNRDFETARNFIKSWGEIIEDYNVENELKKFDEGIKLVQIFISHTRKDKDFLDRFDNVIARVGIKAFRSEFEDISKPEWKTIKEEMDKSAALFFLIGEKLVENQNNNFNDWNYTQNWIAYEIGLACQKGIDVWVLIDNVNINFPLPYFNHYFPTDMKNESFKFLRGVLEHYLNCYKDINPNYRYIANVKCHNCGMEFNLHPDPHKGDKIQCPQCLKYIEFYND